MIVAIGIDIVEVYRIARTIERTPRFAGRFAAKEAFLKALKTGWRGKITWHDIEILSDAEGVPSLQISGEAAALLTRSGAARAHISISHTSEHAVAQVILEA